MCQAFCRCLMSAWASSQAFVFQDFFIKEMHRLPVFGELIIYLLFAHHDFLLLGTGCFYFFGSDLCVPIALFMLNLSYGIKLNLVLKLCKRSTPPIFFPLKCKRGVCRSNLLRGPAAISSPFFRHFLTAHWKGLGRAGKGRLVLSWVIVWPIHRDSTILHPAGKQHL